MNTHTAQRGVTPALEVTPDGFSCPSGPLTAWLRLTLGLALILFFMFGLGPTLAEHQVYERLARVIDENGINSGAFYYTGVEQTAEGEEYLRERLKP